MVKKVLIFNSINKIVVLKKYIQLIDTTELIFEMNNYNSHNTFIFSFIKDKNLIISMFF